MEFAFPAGFWLGLAGGGVLLTHLVRRRARRQVVPFLPVWTAMLAHQRGGLGSAIVRRLDLLLVLLACAAIAVAGAAPFVPGTPDTVRDLVLVLDGGVSLRANERHDRLMKVAAAEIVRRARGTHFVVIGVTDSGASVWSGDDKSDAIAAIQDHRPGWLPAARDQALALGRAAAKRLRASDLVLCTHRRPGREEGFRLRVVNEPVGNAGVSSLEVVGDPEGGGYLAAVGLRGQGAVEIEGHWSGEVEGSRVVEVALPADGHVVLKVRAEGDGFAPDDVAYLALPERKLPRVLVVAEQEASPFLIAALQALRSTGVVDEVDRTDPAHVREAAESYDVFLFDRCAPADRVAGLRALYLAPPGGTLPFRVGEVHDAPAIFDVDRDHALLKGFDLGRVVPLRARAIHGGERLAAAATGPVLCAASGWIALGFDPDRCVLAASPAYPLFLRNCIAHLAPARSAARAEFHAVGEPAPASGVARIEGGGQLRVGERLLGPPGFWKIGDETYAVNLLVPDLDLCAPEEPSDPLPAVGAPGRPERPLSTAFAAAALVVLLLSWWAFWR